MALALYVEKVACIILTRTVMVYAFLVSFTSLHWIQCLDTVSEKKMKNLNYNFFTIFYLFFYNLLSLKS